MRVSRIRLGRMVRRTREALQQELERRLGMRRDAARRIESRGRPGGFVEGTWVTDLAELKQTIILCPTCDPKWRGSASSYGYEHKRNWTEIWGGVIGKCDGCRQNGHQRKAYAHGSLIGKI